ncbi:MAG: hypothetical protein D6812_00365, partial [Deltaproteobacteria bacterium]
NTLKAVGSAIEEMFHYIKIRVGRYGLKPINSAQRRALMEEAFSFANFEGEDLLDLGDDFAEVLDKVVFGGSPSRIARETKTNMTLNLMMKAFEKTEWFNRIVTAHAVKNAFLEQGLKTSGSVFRRSVIRFVEQTQFGQSAVNTPSAFLSAPVLSSPLMKMFLTFPLRTITGAFKTIPELDPDGRAIGLWNVIARGIGISAVAHEIGKNVFGEDADVDRGLFTEAITDIASLDRIAEGGVAGLIPVPPVIDIPVNLIKAAAGGQAVEFARNVARTLPGGVAVYRALGVLPPISPSLSRFRSTFVDWENIQPDGRVPVYKGDGSFVGFQDARTIILRGLGLDLNRFSQQGGIDKILLEAGEQASSYRRSYLLNYTNGNIERANQIAAEYEKRFGIPLTVSRKQFLAFLQSRTVSRTERILNRLPPDIRSQVAPVLAQSPVAENLNIPPEFLRSFTTSSEVSRQGVRELPLDPSTLRLPPGITPQDLLQQGVVEQPLR